MNLSVAFCFLVVSDMLMINHKTMRREVLFWPVTVCHPLLLVCYSRLLPSSCYRLEFDSLSGLR